MFYFWITHAMSSRSLGVKMKVPASEHLQCYCVHCPIAIDLSVKSVICGVNHFKPLFEEIQVTQECYNAGAIYYRNSNHPFYK